MLVKRSQQNKVKSHKAKGVFLTKDYVSIHLTAVLYFPASNNKKEIYISKYYYIINNYNLTLLPNNNIFHFIAYICINTNIWNEIYLTCFPQFCSEVMTCA